MGSTHSHGYLRTEKSAAEGTHVYEFISAEVPGPLFSTSHRVQGAVTGAGTAGRGTVGWAGDRDTDLHFPGGRTLSCSRFPLPLSSLIHLPLVLSFSALFLFHTCALVLSGCPQAVLGLAGGTRMRSSTDHTELSPNHSPPPHSAPLPSPRHVSLPSPH